MENSTPTVAWVCLGREELSAATAVLTDASNDVSPWTSVGRIGMSRVLVDFNSPSKEIRIPELLMSGKQHRAAGGYPKPEAVVVTGSAAAPTAGARVGDVLIGPCSELPISPDASSSNYVLRRAVDVLRGEVGEDGYWLISSSGDQGSIAAINTKGLTKDTPRLHYIRDIEELIRIPSQTGGLDITMPYIIILGIDNKQTTEKSSSKQGGPENAASYAREIIQLMAEPSVKKIQSLKGTEQIIPSLQTPYIAPFPTYQYPNCGNAVLLVIPTENKAKTALFRECLVERHPEGLEVHSLTVPVESNVGEQPYDAAGAQGAYNRICNALRRLADGGIGSGGLHAVFTAHAIGTVMVACAENFIQTRGLARPADFGIVIVHNATSGRTAGRVTRGVTAPPEMVARARRFGSPDGHADHGNVTVGTVLAARVPGIDKADWHVVLAGKSRYDLLKEALEGTQIPW